jgi:hypothetical protein
MSNHPDHGQHVEWKDQFYVKICNKLFCDFYGLFVGKSANFP